MSSSGRDKTGLGTLERQKGTRTLDKADRQGAIHGNALDVVLGLPRTEWISGVHYNPHYDTQETSAREAIWKEITSESFVIFLNEIEALQKSGKKSDEEAIATIKGEIQKLMPTVEVTPERNQADSKYYSEVQKHMQAVVATVMYADLFIFRDHLLRVNQDYINSQSEKKLDKKSPQDSATEKLFAASDLEEALQYKYDAAKKRYEDRVNKYDVVTAMQQAESLVDILDKAVRMKSSRSVFGENSSIGVPTGVAKIVKPLQEALARFHDYCTKYKVDLSPQALTQGESAAITPPAATRTTEMRRDSDFLAPPPSSMPRKASNLSSMMTQVEEENKTESVKAPSSLKRQSSSTASVLSSTGSNADRDAKLETRPDHKEGETRSPSDQRPTAFFEKRQSESKAPSSKVEPALPKHKRHSM